LLRLGGGALEFFSHNHENTRLAEGVPWDVHRSKGSVLRIVPDGDSAARCPYLDSL
jgi:hypothetical protein